MINKHLSTDILSYLSSWWLVNVTNGGYKNYSLGDPVKQFSPHSHYNYSCIEVSENKSAWAIIIIMNKFFHFVHVHNYNNYAYLYVCVSC